jgi:hypothetical protein
MAKEQMAPETSGVEVGSRPMDAPQRETQWGGLTVSAVPQEDPSGDSGDALVEPVLAVPAAVLAAGEVLTVAAASAVHLAGPTGLAWGAASAVGVVGATTWTVRAHRAAASPAQRALAAARRRPLLMRPARPAGSTWGASTGRSRSGRGLVGTSGRGLLGRPLRGGSRSSRGLLGRPRPTGTGRSTSMGRGRVLGALGAPARAARTGNAKASRAVRRATRRATNSIPMIRARRAGAGLAGAVRRSGARRAAVRAATAGARRPFQATKAAWTASRQTSKGTAPRSRILRTVMAMGRGLRGAAVAARVAAWVGLMQGAQWSWWGLRAWGALPNRKPTPPKPYPVVGTQVQDGPVMAATQTVRAADGGTMSRTGTSLGRVLEDLSGQMASASARYTPAGMLAWERDIQALAAVMENVAGSVSALQAGAEGMPVDPAVRDALGSVVRLLTACTGAAGEIHSTFRAVHAQDLSRHEAPRPAEEMWDRGANQ